MIIVSTSFSLLQVVSGLLTTVVVTIDQEVNSIFFLFSRWYSHLALLLQIELVWVRLRNIS
jgi:hypothetical protein